ncbi:site-specific DNA-methyltransferase [[Mycobacterium] zoologicum]|uniref:site-specific DNA-methyltransferase n=1 Tax=[Mycobacterium] zoologicum TaxID=2872311 RepID=UPI001CDB0E73|nr:site-specific DNA-methyltransferase [Mycolicibacter sp. MYC101]MEB3064447.1 site-specific DNA-methyltransferase [Mycolicibacter sp. MYC101]
MLPADDRDTLAHSSKPTSVLSPKRPVDDKAGLADLFPYYAGFSYKWAKQRFDEFDLPANALVLDPWNGSGTSLVAAQATGIASVGVDLNPVACAVARLKVEGLGASIPVVKPPQSVPTLADHEPLLAWFSPRAAERLRSWADARPQPQGSLSTIVVKVSLFRVARCLTKRFEGSNPTWVRISRGCDECVDVAPAVIDELMIEAQVGITSRLLEYHGATTPSSVVMASSKHLPLASASVDAILTSPPYLTRIDYGVAYSRELAVLGIQVGRDRSMHSRALREQLMGTTLIRRSAMRELSVAATANDLLKRVADHPSKASGGYYLKQIRQYLQDLTQSLDELTRVAKSGALMTLVVQDSYYKDVPIPLAAICVEEAQARGWLLVGEPAERDVKRHLTQLNTAARAYIKGKVAESEITLRSP